ncbi:PspC domain-containing protein [Gordonia phthalatica]|uniref:Phage-shock protein n=1 Tax=Gordonia phthalatica TaxID=1136941 RepID=A0A0N9NIQ0_9ACTN|nr:PspC domain-containing protein [Gordonia phthalatica]ALG85417.1 phage-shock protein [Gordonia phthalatica]
MTGPGFPDSYGAYEPQPVPQRKRLTRSSTDRMLGGVAGGLAEYFGVDSTWVRIAFAASIILPGPQVLLYLILWLVIPKG